VPAAPPPPPFGEGNTSRQELYFRFLWAMFWWESGEGGAACCSEGQGVHRLGIEAQCSWSQIQGSGFLDFDAEGSRTGGNKVEERESG
jgi:hypothetical protein